jgi:hypothetical protein
MAARPGHMVRAKLTWESNAPHQTGPLPGARLRPRLPAPGVPVTEAKRKRRVPVPAPTSSAGAVGSRSTSQP